MQKSTGRRFPWSSLVATLSAIFYGVSPIDLIPDIVPLLGFADDAVAVPVLLLLAALWYRNGRMVPARQSATPNAPPIDVRSRRIDG